MPGLAPGPVRHRPAGFSSSHRRSKIAAQSEWPRGAPAAIACGKLRERASPPRSATYAPFTQKVRKHEPAEPASTQHPASDQQANQPAFVAAVLLFADLLTLFLFLFLLVPLSQEMGQEQVAKALPANYAASNQEANEPAFVTAVLLFAAVFTVILFLVPLPQEMCQEQTAKALPANYPAADQQAGEPALVTAALLFADVVIVLFLAPLAQKMRKYQAAKASASHDAAADEQTSKRTFVDAAALLVVV